jgi:hypothetical protein
VASVRERQRVVRRSEARAQPGRWRRAGAAAIALSAAGVAVVGLTGCGKIDQALNKQWMVVNFSPDTSAATVLHIRAACSHIQNTPPLPLPAKQSVIDVMYGVQFDTTNSSPANLAQLQICLGKFKSVLGVNAEDTGGEGS